MIDLSVYKRLLPTNCTLGNYIWTFIRSYCYGTKWKCIKTKNVGGGIKFSYRSDVDACFTVHRKMGPGLSEAIYEECLTKEFTRQKINYRSQVKIQIKYDGEILKKYLVLDMLVEDEVIIELKAVEGSTDLFEAQLLAYLKLTGKQVGYLINFNVKLLKYGIRRLRIS